MRIIAALLMLVAFGSVPTIAHAQFGLEGSPEELEAFYAVQGGRAVRARELAEAILRKDPRSYVGHFVLGLAHQNGEANFPVAYRELRLALDLYAERYGDPPADDAPFRWHAAMLGAFAHVQGDLERHEERLVTLDRHDALYQPHMLAERAWSLMKLRRFELARRAAREALASPLSFQVEMGLNALCAIEFEAGEYGKSYEACKAALDYGRASGDGPSVVDLTNFAEAARTELRLQEAESVLVEATGLEDGGYGNPFLELGELYVREARLEDALEALRRVPTLRQGRPPATRDSDRAESQRALAAFYLAMARPADALRIAELALHAPDRRGHNSRDPAQDQAIVALFHRHASRFAALTAAVATEELPMFARLRALVDVVALELSAWESGRTIVRLLRDRDRLVGILRVGLSTGGITPTYLAADLAEILGPGAFEAAVREARRGDPRPLARPYYLSLEGEAAFLRGDLRRARGLVERALAAMPMEEGLLRARALARLGEVHARQGAGDAAARRYAEAYALDPSVFARLRVPLHVRIDARGARAREVRDALLDEGPFSGGGLFGPEPVVAGLAIDDTRAGVRACLTFRGSRARCVEVERAPRRGARTSEDSTAVRTLLALLGPSRTLAATDVASLEGPMPGTRQRISLPSF